MFVKILTCFLLVSLEVGLNRSEEPSDGLSHQSDPFRIVSDDDVIGLFQPDPPPKNETARMARYIVHYSDWCALAHISLHANTTGFPAARVYSTADGFKTRSTGVPYFYVSKMDAHIDDLSTDGRCSVTMSLAEGDYCRKQSLDPEDPRCAQVILTGHFLFLDPESAQAQKAKLFLFERHPVMKSWPKGHSWQVGKLKISHIQVADNFGGSAYPSIEEYFKAKP